MSFVSMVVRYDFLSVVTDGRVITQNDRVIRNEHHNKISIATPNFFLASCGHREIGELLGEILLLQGSYENDIDSVISTIKETVKKVSTNKAIQLRVFFGGKINGRITGFYIDDKDQNLLTIKPELHQVGLYFNESSKDGDLRERYFDKIIRQNDINEIIKYQKEMNDVVASYEDSVNTVHFEHLIRL